MTDKEQIIIDGVDVSECKHLYSRWTGSLPKDTCAEYDYINNPEDDGLINLCKTHPNCYYKQLQKEKFENLNNRQMVESAENLIYENSELYKNLKEKEQECEQIKEKYEALKLENQEGYEIVAELKHECEELKGKYKNILDLAKQNADANEYCLQELEQENYRYSKALEEIEAATKINCEEICGRKFENCNDTSCFSVNILDIIQKVKQVKN